MSPVNPRASEQTDEVTSMPPTLKASFGAGARRTASSTKTEAPTEMAAKGAGTRRMVAMWAIVATVILPLFGRGTLTNSRRIATTVRITNAGSQCSAEVVHLAGITSDTIPARHTQPPNDPTLSACQCPFGARIQRLAVARVLRAAARPRFIDEFIR